MKKIWNNVDDACGGSHNFEVTTDPERPNVVRVVDMIYQTNQAVPFDEIIELDIQSNTSVVRDFQYTTSIPSSMTATIAVAAQAPDSVDALEKSSFAALHTNIINRFAMKQPPTVPKEETWKNWEEDFRMAKTNYVEGLTKLQEFKIEILKGEYQVLEDDGSNSNSEEVGVMKGLLKTVTSSANLLNKMCPVIDHPNGKYKGEILKDSSQPRSAIIPLKFTAVLDGISGIVIGNVFKLPSSRLPRGYKDANVAFVCMGENQEVGANQDWKTKITGQMVLVDVPGRGTSDGAGDWDYNDFNEDAENPINYTEKERGFFWDSEQNITSEQSTLDPYIDEIRVYPESPYSVYLKMSTETNIRNDIVVDNNYNDNIACNLPKGNKGLYLGTVVDIKSQDLVTAESVEALGLTRDEDGFFYNSSGQKMENTSLPWYLVEFSLSGTAYEKMDCDNMFWGDDLIDDEYNSIYNYINQNFWNVESFKYEYEKESEEE